MPSAPSIYHVLTRRLRERGIPPRLGRAAARTGALRVVRPGKRKMFTTDEWIDQWLSREVVPPSPSAEARAAAIAARMSERVRR